MSDLIQLTDAEVDLVSGGDQSNAAEVVQVAENSGDAVAIGSGATAVAAAFNVSVLRQSNSISIRRGRR
ncbi:MAG: hypothetical protein JO143_13955 [Acetobacteraceae bacterium]|nr:hypothetical protein [Acetobacteraceae bacterium]